MKQWYRVKCFKHILLKSIKRFEICLFKTIFVIVDEDIDENIVDQGEYISDAEEDKEAEIPDKSDIKPLQNLTCITIFITSDTNFFRFVGRLHEPWPSIKNIPKV